LLSDAVALLGQVGVLARAEEGENEHAGVRFVFEWSHRARADQLAILQSLHRKVEIHGSYACAQALLTKLRERYTLVARTQCFRAEAACAEISEQFSQDRFCEIIQIRRSHAA
jgi:hypothetical protein